MLYRVVLFFVIRQQESATGIHRSHPSRTPFSPPTPPHGSRWSQSTELPSLCHTANSHLLSVFRMVMYMLPYYSLSSSHPLLSPAVSSSLFSMSVPPLCLCAKSLQSRPTLCDPVDHSPSGSSAPGHSQARILEWVAMPSSRGSSQPRD